MELPPSTPAQSRVNSSYLSSQEKNNTIDIIGQFDCVINFDILMTGPDLFTVNYVTNNVSCPNSEDGSIEIECSGGVPPYSYEWFLNNNLYEESQNINKSNK